MPKNTTQLAIYKAFCDAGGAAHWYETRNKSGTYRTKWSVEMGARHAPMKALADALSIPYAICESYFGVVGARKREHDYLVEAWRGKTCEVIGQGEWGPYRAPSNKRIMPDGSYFRVMPTPFTTEQCDEWALLQKATSDAGRAVFGPPDADGCQDEITPNRFDDFGFSITIPLAHKLPNEEIAKLGASFASSEDKLFRSAILSAPNDDLPKLIYADWLEENGDPVHAHAIRLSSQYK